MLDAIALFLHTILNMQCWKSGIFKHLQILALDKAKFSFISRVHFSTAPNNISQSIFIPCI